MAVDWRAYQMRHGGPDCCRVGRQTTHSAHVALGTDEYFYVEPRRMVATLCRTSGTSSSSNHAFFFSQMLFRGLG